MPGNRVQRYSVNWTQPNLFGYSPWSLSLGGFLFSRVYRDWEEQHLGARGMLGYQITPDLSFSTELRGEDVKISNPRVNTLAALNDVVGSNDLYTGRFRLAHNTRDSPYIPTEGHFLELVYDQVFGTNDYPRGQVNFSKYFLIREQADGGGRHTLTSSWKFGFSGEDTPLFENYFAGGHTTMRGFAFRGASPVDQGVQVGGRFMFLGSLEYMFPLTADDMLRSWSPSVTMERSNRISRSTGELPSCSWFGAGLQSPHSDQHPLRLTSRIQLAALTPMTNRSSAFQSA